MKKVEIKNLFYNCITKKYIKIVKANFNDTIRKDYRVYLEPILATACSHQAEKVGVRTMSRYIRRAVIRALKADGYPLDNISENFTNFDPIPSTMEEKARQQLNYAIQIGKIIPPEKCSGCGVVIAKSKNQRRRIYAHHQDYNKPLDVIWLCAYCHHDIHKNHSDTIIKHKQGMTPYN